jgi:hypothetical protein
MDGPRSLFDAPKERCVCNDTGAGVWIMGDSLRACGFCDKGSEMAAGGYLAEPHEAMTKEEKIHNV